MHPLQLDFYHVTPARYHYPVEVRVRWGVVDVQLLQRLEWAFEALEGVESVSMSRYSAVLYIAPHMFDTAEFHKLVLIAIKDVARTVSVELHLTATEFGVALT